MSDFAVGTIDLFEAKENIEKHFIFFLIVTIAKVNQAIII